MEGLIYYVVYIVSNRDRGEQANKWFGLIAHNNNFTKLERAFY